MKKLLLTFLLLLLPVVVSASENIQKVSLPIEVKQEMKVSDTDPIIEGKVWNRWTSKNFVVCSIDNKQAQYLHQHLELVKGWVLSRWGLYDIPFSSECRVIAVDDPVLYEKLFKIKKSKVEIRRDESGKIKMTVIFLLLDQAPASTVPIPLTEVCMAEFQQRYNTNFGWWAHRGMGQLSGDLLQIRQNITDLSGPLTGNQPMYFSEGLLSMTREAYEKETPEKKRLFDQTAMAFCLLIRKEFGQNKFHWMLKRTENSGDGQVALKETLGFESYAQFDQTFRRYMLDLSRDVSQNKTPDNYLQVNESKK